MFDQQLVRADEARRDLVSGEPGCASRRSVLRSLAAGACTTAAGSIAAACGAVGEPPPSKKERTSAYSVRFMALGTNPWMLEQLERYNKEIGPAKKIQVAPEPQPDQAALFAKFQSTVASGDAPDVARLKEIWVFEMYLKGVMQRLDGYFKTDKEFNANDLLPLYQDNFKFKGENYAIAREVSIIVGYYNKANFADAGLDPNKPPTTYDEFREYAKRLTKTGASTDDAKWGFDVYEYGTREFVLLWLMMHVRRWGGGFWNKEKTGIEINTPVWLETFQYFVDLINKDRSTRPSNVNVPSGRTNGKIAMWDQGTWDIPLHPKSVPDLNFGVFLWPKKVNQQHIPTSGSSAMTKASKDQDATWEFMKWWNTPENQIGWYHN